ncbi:N,N-dimethylformamidase beta subunit family domain-containing protein [Streptomyces sp. NPDC006971]|uniref:N,N-dimethylformamidase beta subunit family domain-containing protein n=1 Tax=Streptomyces sp. NPDC006971 TaxID=3154784 RepID=UPI0033C17134
MCPGHDECWSGSSVSAPPGAPDVGTGVAFPGANTCFRQVRSNGGPRFLVT